MRFGATEHAEFVFLYDDLEVIAGFRGSAVEPDHCFVLEGELFPRLVAVHLSRLSSLGTALPPWFWGR